MRRLGDIPRGDDARRRRVAAVNQPAVDDDDGTHIESRTRDKCACRTRPQVARVESPCAASAARQSCTPCHTRSTRNRSRPLPRTRWRHGSFVDRRLSAATQRLDAAATRRRRASRADASRASPATRTACRSRRDDRRRSRPRLCRTRRDRPPIDARASRQRAQRSDRTTATEETRRRERRAWRDDVTMKHDKLCSDRYGQIK